MDNITNRSAHALSEAMFKIVLPEVSKGAMAIRILATMLGVPLSPRGGDTANGLDVLVGMREDLDKIIAVANDREAIAQAVKAVTEKYGPPPGEVGG